MSTEHLTASTRRMVYATIANAVLAGMPEPTDQQFTEHSAWLTFDSPDDARLWARWHSTDCLDSQYVADSPNTGRRLWCYYGERMGWLWSIVGRELLTPQEQEATPVNGNDRLLIPCGRCGHEEDRHGRGDADVRLCLDCDQVCVPVVPKAAS